MKLQISLSNQKYHKGYSATVESPNLDETEISLGVNFLPCLGNKLNRQYFWMPCTKRSTRSQLTEACSGNSHGVEQTREQTREQTKRHDCFLRPVKFN